MCRGSPQAVHSVALQGHVGSDPSPLRSTLVQLLLVIASTYLRDSTSLTYTYAACRRPLRLILHLFARRSTGSAPFTFLGPLGLAEKCSCQVVEVSLELF